MENIKLKQLFSQYINTQFNKDVLRTFIDDLSRLNINFSHSYLDDYGNFDSSHFEKWIIELHDKSFISICVLDDYINYIELLSSNYDTIFEVSA